MTSARLVLVACCMAAAGGWLRLSAASEIVPHGTQLPALPFQLGEWQARDEARLDPDSERVLQADAYLLREYTRGPVPVTLFVAYYASQRIGHTTHSPLNCLPGAGWEWVEQRNRRVSVAPERSIEISGNIAQRNGRQVIVDYWYQSRGRAVAGEYQNKLLLMRDAFTLHRSDGALVRVTAPLTDVDSPSASEVEAFIQAVYPSLTARLQG